MIPSLVFVASLLTAPAPATATVQGQVRSAGERTPIAGAKIFATAKRGPAWTRTAVSTSDGNFKLADLPSREFVLIIVASGHERFEQPTPAKFWTGRRPPVIFVQPTGAGKYRTIVADSRSERLTPSRTRLAPEEVAVIPGSQGDPLRALQNLPGNARIPFGLGLLVLRGASPNQTQVFFGEHPIPRAFHYPGLASVMQAGVLAGIEYVPSNFDSSRGNAVGGLVTMTPRVGRRDGIHGHAKLDIVSAGALIEGPVGKGSFLVAAQRGYLDWALGRLPADTGIDNFGKPKNFDYQAIFDHPLRAGASLTTRILGARDEIKLANWGENDRTLDSTFHRIDLVYRKRRPRWDVLLAPSVRLDRGATAAEKTLLQRRDTVGLLRAELTVRPTKWFQITVGADTQLDGYRSVSRQYFQVAPQQTELRSSDDHGFTSSSGAYATAELTIRRVTLAPGVRASLFTGPLNSRAAAADPRLVVRWAPHRRVTLSAGAGLYSQASAYGRSALAEGLPGFEYIDLLSLSYINADLIAIPGILRQLDLSLGVDPRAPIGLMRAVQVSGGARVDLPGSLALEASGFFRAVRDGLPRREPDDPEPPNAGTMTYGFEALLRRDLSRRLHGWISYTYMHADRGVWDSRTLTERTPSTFDQRHNLAMVLLLKLPHRWTLGGRFRVVTGVPFTPVVGGLHTGVEVRPIRGPTNGAYMPTFHQLDLRIDKTWVQRRTIVSAYLDVQNVYNRQNAEVLQYSPPYDRPRAGYGLPILPVIGVHVRY